MEGQTDSSLRRLIPFSGASVLTPSLPAQSGAALSNPASAVADAIGQQAASIVSQAASILNDEMAKGLLGRAGVTAPPGLTDGSSPVLRQMHEVIDKLAKLWPDLQSGLTPQLPAGSQPATSDTDPLAEVRPRATVKPGQRATISMTVCNSENRRVQLVPIATDLLGSRGGRLRVRFSSSRPRSSRCNHTNRKTSRSRQPFLSTPHPVAIRVCSSSEDWTTSAR